MTPPFSDPRAQQRWDTYFAEVDRLVALAGTDAAGLDTELRQHLADSWAAKTDGSADQRLALAIAQLGDPEDFLRPLMADAVLDRASRSYNPATVTRGLGLAIRAGSRRAARGVMFAAAYVLLAIFAAMSLLKPFLAQNIGLIRGADGSLTFGITDTAGTDIMGYWSIPLTLAACAVIYLLLTRALRRPGG